MRHRFHALCPYFAMFPESFAERWICELTAPGDVVLDPFSGRGTTALTAVLLGRRAVACDVNDVAYCLTRAKTSPPPLCRVLQRIDRLADEFDGRKWRTGTEALPDFFQMAFHGRTLQQILCLREKLDWRKGRTDTMIAALALGSLHGESSRSPFYFSNQMPRTISTKPAYSMRYWRDRELTAPRRDVFEILRQRAVYRYASERPQGDAWVYHRDMRTLTLVARALPNRPRCVVTSPPYYDVTNFEEDQWLRLWFLGGPPYPTRKRVSRDDRHTLEDRYWRFIADMWRSLSQLVARRGHVVVRIGSARLKPTQLEVGLTGTSQFANRPIVLRHREISELRNRQTDAFRPGARGCRVEIDCHFQFLD